LFFPRRILFCLPIRVSPSYTRLPVIFVRANTLVLNICGPRLTVNQNSGDSCRYTKQWGCKAMREAIKKNSPSTIIAWISNLNCIRSQEGLVITSNRTQHMPSWRLTVTYSRNSPPSWDPTVHYRFGLHPDPAISTPHPHIPFLKDGCNINLTSTSRSTFFTCDIPLCVNDMNKQVNIRLNTTILIILVFRHRPIDLYLPFRSFVQFRKHFRHFHAYCMIHQSWLDFISLRQWFAKYRVYTKEWRGFNSEHYKTAPFFCVCPVYPRIPWAGSVDTFL
jgi:hypothetical protein